MRGEERDPALIRGKRFPGCLLCPESAPLPAVRGSHIPESTEIEKSPPAGGLSKFGPPAGGFSFSSPVILYFLPRRITFQEAL